MLVAGDRDRFVMIVVAMVAVSLILAVLAMLFGNNCGGKVEVVEVEVEQSFIFGLAAAFRLKTAAVGKFLL